MPMGRGNVSTLRPKAAGHPASRSQLLLTIDSVIRHLQCRYKKSLVRDRVLIDLQTNRLVNERVTDGFTRAAEDPLLGRWRDSGPLQSPHPRTYHGEDPR
ncbi:hypothetical protein VTN31DRAFT_2208 [Thermomyces dupontii]|uniref:uncharacterized protein n=1 Tax=Talaromyces thermophilus TaxID=28565 RepID=UPI0037422E57